MSVILLSEINSLIFMKIDSIASGRTIKGALARRNVAYVSVNAIAAL